LNFGSSPNPATGPMSPPISGAPGAMNPYGTPPPTGNPYGSSLPPSSVGMGTTPTSGFSLGSSPDSGRGQVTPSENRWSSDGNAASPQVPSQTPFK
jgi:hypothetical protein